MTLTRCFAALLVLGIAGAARARTDIPWDGPYLGLNLGDASSSTCNTWALSRANLDSATAAEFNQRTCFTGGAFVGGAQLGENFQYRRLVLGVGAGGGFRGGEDRPARRRRY